jgi:hypothetical protein
LEVYLFKDLLGFLAQFPDIEVHNGTWVLMGLECGQEDIVKSECQTLGLASK